MKKVILFLVRSTIIFAAAFTSITLAAQSEDPFLAYASDPDAANFAEYPTETPDISTNINAVNQIRTYISRHIEYPDMALEMGIEGKVVVEVKVAENGDILSKTILTGFNSQVDKTVLNSLNGLERVQPVVLNGKRKAKRILVAVIFKN